MIPSLVDGRAEIVALFADAGAPITKVYDHDTPKEAPGQCWVTIDVESVEPDQVTWTLRIYAKYADAGPGKATGVRDAAVDEMERLLDLAPASIIGPSQWRFGVLDEQSLLVAACSVSRGREDLLT